MAVIHTCNNCKKEHVYKVTLNSFRCNYCNHNEYTARAMSKKGRSS